MLLITPADAFARVVPFLVAAGSVALLLQPALTARGTVRRSPRSTAALGGIAAIDDAKTLVWNGPVGAFEIAPFDQGTVAAARHAAERTKAGKLVSVAGGGDTVRALNAAGAASGFTYVSTAGGAFLEWLGGHELPAVRALARSGARSAP